MSLKRARGKKPVEVVPVGAMRCTVRVVITKTLWSRNLSVKYGIFSRKTTNEKEVGHEAVR
jgi:hypothetical protein